MKFLRRGAAYQLVIFLCYTSAVWSQGTLGTISPHAGFLENKGEIVDQNGLPNPEVLYLLTERDFKLQLRRNAFSYEVLQKTIVPVQGMEDLDRHARKSDDAYETQIASHRIDVEFSGANSSPGITVFGKSDEYWNFIQPHVSVEGILEVHTYKTVIYSDLYPGIDLRYDITTAASGTVQVKYSFVVYPGADPQNIRMVFRGQNAVYLHEGGLLCETAYGSIVEEKPYAFTNKTGSTNPHYTGNVPVSCAMEMQGDTLEFRVGVYDSSKVLVIDPSVIWCTYFGGTSMDRGYGSAIFSTNDIAVTGRTESINIATAGAYQTKHTGDDGYIAKFSSDSQLIWATYFGGNGLDTGRDIVVTQQDEIYVAGITASDSLGTNDVHQSVCGGNWDAFLVKFTSSGGRVWSTYFGGAATEWVGFGLTVRGNDITIVGCTTSDSGIATSGAHQELYTTGEDAYIAVFDIHGKLQWATYYGGTLDDYAIDVVTDNGGNVYVTGQSYSRDGIATASSYQFERGDGMDGFLARFSPDGVLQWGTYIGGAGTDAGFSVALVGSSVVVTGETSSDSLVSNNDAYQQNLAGSTDVFLMRFDSSGARLWGTYYGGAGDDRGNAITTAGNKIFLTGTTNSTSGITTADAIQDSLLAWNEVFYSEFDLNGNLYYGTYFGGSQEDIGYDIEIDANSQIVIVGETASTGLATTGTYQEALAGSTDAFILKFDVETKLEIIPDAGDDISICAADSVELSCKVIGGTSPYTYQWSPIVDINDAESPTPTVSPSVTTSYIVQITDAENNTAYDTVTVMVLPPPVVDAGEDVVICSNVLVQLHADISGGLEPYVVQWSPTDGLSAADTSDVVATPTISRNYVVTVTDANGCHSNDTVRVTVGSTLEISAGIDRTICLGGSTTLMGGIITGTSPYTYSWEPDTALSSSTALQPVASPMVTTTYHLCVTDSMGCTECDSMTVFVSDPFIVDAGNDRYVCGADSIELHAGITGSTTALTYSWTPFEGLSSDTESTVRAHPVQTTEYIVTVTDVNGCYTMDTVTVFVNEEIPFAAGDDVTICAGDTAYIGMEAPFGEEPRVYHWSPSAGLSDTSSAVVAAFPAVTQNYIVTVTAANGCIGRDTVQVLVNASPSVDIAGVPALCAGDSTQLTATITGATEPVMVQWSPGDVLSDSTIRNPYAFPSVTTEFIVRVTGANGCAATDTVLVTVDVPPSLNVNPLGTVQICAGDSVVISAQGNAARYEWSTGDTTGAIVVRQQGTYFVQAMSSHGCITTSDSIVVSVIDSIHPVITGALHVCTANSVPYSVEPEGMAAYQWSILGGDVLQGHGTAHILVQWDMGETTGALNVMVVEGNCSGGDSLDIVLSGGIHPLLSESGERVICQNSSITLQTEEQYTRYLWSTGDTTESIEIATEGMYYVWAEDSLECNGYSDTLIAVLSTVPPVGISGSHILCNGSTGILDAGTGYEQYLWSTGDTTRTITIADSGVYSVTALDTNGCSSTDQVTVELSHGIPPEIIGDSIQCTGGTVQLAVGDVYPEYLWSTGDTTREITVTGSGLYWVLVQDTNGCSMSDTMNVVFSDYVHVRMQVEREVAAPGAHVRIAIRIVEPEDLHFLEGVPFTGTLRFERSVLQPLSHMYSDEEGQRYVSFSGTVSGTSDTLVIIECLATLGQTDTSALVIEDVTFDLHCPQVDFIDGFMTVRICEEGGRRLIYSFAGSIEAENSPNPFVDVTRITWTLPYPSHIRITITNVLGETLATLLDAPREPGTYMESFLSGQLPSGVYYYVIESSRERIVNKMRVVK